MLFCNCFSSLSNLTCYCPLKIICNIDGNSIRKGKKMMKLAKMQIFTVPSYFFRGNSKCSGKFMANY
jgi:hypothetical protein